MAAVYGNYTNYQGSSRHDGRTAAAHVVDTRLRRLDDALPSLFRDCRILDIGCNSGGVALDLALHFQPRSIHGVDIDPQLIKKAHIHLSYRYSRVGPTGEPDYFPTSSVAEHGHRSYPTDPYFMGFPRNVTFADEDWGAEMLDGDQTAVYDVVLALSVVKWIHIHHGDRGLNRLFLKIYSALSPGGLFILEPQEWASYEKAVKKTKGVLKDKVASLTIKPEDFHDMLERSFELVTKLGVGEGLGRDIFVYRKL